MRKSGTLIPHKIVVEGCSAGGHLAASLGVFWDEDFLAESQGLSASEHELLRPDGLLLCYPVITSGEFAHRGSFENLLGSRQEELGEKLSLEKQVTNKVPTQNKLLSFDQLHFIFHFYESIFFIQWSSHLCRL